jgi:hypothetical protein
MIEKNLGQALVAIGGSTPASLESVFRQTERVLRRSQIGSRILAIVATLLLVLSLATVALFFYLYWAQLHPVWSETNHRIETIDGLPLEEANAERGTQIALFALRRTDTLFLACVFAVFWFACSIVALTGAGLTSVWLILSSRRATVRHVNACLIEISEQLKQLQPPSPDAPRG